jgi:hypothetical protein
MTKCRWCEDPIPEGERYCDDTCRKLHDNHSAQVTDKDKLGRQNQQRQKVKENRNSKLHGDPRLSDS